MLKVQNIKLVKHIDVLGGIMTDRFDSKLFDIYKNCETMEYIVHKREGAGSEKTFSIPFSATCVTEYFKREDVLPAERPTSDDDGEPVKRGPGRPP